MGNDASIDARMAVGRKWMTHAQAVIDSDPSSVLSDAEKEHCYRVLEEHAYWAWIVLNGTADVVREFVQNVIVKFPLMRPDAPHHYRGVAEMPPPTVTHALTPEAAPPASPSAPANAAAAAPQPEQGPAEEEPAVLAGASSSAAAVVCRSSGAEDDGAVDEERVPLITKKTQ